MRRGLRRRAGPMVLKVLPAPIGGGDVMSTSATLLSHFFWAIGSAENAHTLSRGWGTLRVVVIRTRPPFPRCGLQARGGCVNGSHESAQAGACHCSDDRE